MPLELGAVIAPRNVQDLEQGLARIKRCGYSSVQLNIPSPLDPRLLAEGLRIAAEEGLRIAAFGCYVNPLNPHAARSGGEFGACESDLRALLDAVPPRAAQEQPHFVVCWSGTLAAALHQILPGNAMPAAQQELAAWLRAREVQLERAGAVLLLHPHATHVLHSHAAAYRLFQQVTSPRIGMLFDFCNWMLPKNYHDKDQWILAALEALAPCIGLVHLKDAQIGNFKVDLCCPGLGQLGYAWLLKQLRRNVPGCTWIVDGAASELQLRRAREYVMVQNSL